MTEKRKSYVVSRAGNIKNLQMETEHIPEPRENEVLVAVRSIGLNFADIFAILGLYSATPEGSFIPGLEFAGEVIKTGPGVGEFTKGDRVMGVTRFGGYTTHITSESAYLQKIPVDWNYDQGAAFLVQTLTAYYGLYTLGQLKENETVLIHSAAGGVGLMANRLAKKKNAVTIGTVGNARKLDLLKQEAYDHGIVRSGKFGSDLDDILKGEKLDVVMECIGGKIFRAGYERLAPRGRMVVYGSARYGDQSDRPNWLRLAWLYLTRPKIDPQKMIELNRSVHGFNLIWLYEQKELMHTILSELEAFSLSAPHVGHSFPFEELPKAIKLFQSGTTTGKVVIHT